MSYLECPGNKEPGHLVADSDQQSDREIIVVKDVHRHRKVQQGRHGGGLASNPAAYIEFSCTLVDFTILIESLTQQTSLTMLKTTI